MKNNRDYKNFCADNIYHIYNRGTAKMGIFIDDNDYLFFLKRLYGALYPSKIVRFRNQTYKPIQLPENSFILITYCLMPNHYHIVIKQNSDVSISKLILKVCTSYTKYFNKKYDRVGALFQDTFKSVLIESDEQINILLEYIQMNPVKAGLVNEPHEYRWSPSKVTICPTHK